MYVCMYVGPTITLNNNQIIKKYFKMTDHSRYVASTDYSGAHGSQEEILTCSEFLSVNYLRQLLVLHACLTILHVFSTFFQIS